MILFRFDFASVKWSSELNMNKDSFHLSFGFSLRALLPEQSIKIVQRSDLWRSSFETICPQQISFFVLSRIVFQHIEVKVCCWSCRRRIFRVCWCSWHTSFGLTKHRSSISIEGKHWSSSSCRSEGESLPNLRNVMKWIVWCLMCVEQVQQWKRSACAARTPF